MAVTPNYNWPLPDDTSLVKDGAQAIRDLGNAIDTTVEDIPIGSPPGLVHIKTATFSGAVSHSFGDDTDPIFSSTFDNYKIIFFNMQATTSNQDLKFRLRANTSNLTTNVYDNQTLTSGSTSVTGSRNNGQTNSRIGSCGTDANSNLFITEMQNPFATKTKILFSSGTQVHSGVGLVTFQSANLIRNSTSFNGFNIFAATNLSGSLSVYGYKI